MKKIDIDQKDFWEFISSNQKLDENFIAKYFESLNWENICEFQKINERMLTIFNKYIVWYWVWRNQKVSEEIIEKFAGKANSWDQAFQWNNFSNKFLMKHLDKISDWFHFKPYIKKKIPTAFFDYAIKNNKGIDWDYFINYKKVNKQTLKKYKDVFSHMEIDMSDFTEDEINFLIENGYQLKNIFSEKPLSAKFIREHIDEIDWTTLSRYQNFDIDSLREFEDKINWWQYSRRSDITLEVINEFADKLEWTFISNYYKNMDKNFTDKYGDRLEILSVVTTNDNDVNEEWLDSVYNSLDYTEVDGLYKRHKLSEQFLEKHLKGKREWKRHAAYVRGLSEGFMRKHKNEINWHIASATQKMSMKFMEEFADKIDWVEASINQKMSEKFIRKHWDKVSWGEILLNQKLSMPFINELAEMMDYGND